MKKDKKRNENNLKPKKSTEEGNITRKTKSKEDTVTDQLESIHLSDNEDEVMCPICNQDVGGLWICCDECNTWFHTSCLRISSQNIPDVYVCVSCGN